MDECREGEQGMLMRTEKYRCYPGAQAVSNACWVMGHVMKSVWNETRWHIEHNRMAIAGVLAVNERLPKERHVPVPRPIGKRGPYELVRTDLHPEYAGTNAQSRQMMQAALHASYESYFALRKNGHADARPPGRMKWCGWVTYHQNGWRLEGHTLHLAGIGSIPIRMHRKIRGKIKTVTLRVKNGRWYVCFACEITDFPGACRSQDGAKASNGNGLGQKRASSGGRDHKKWCADNEADNKQKGIDGGRDHKKGGIIAVWLDVDGLFLCDSDGRRVEVPGFYENALGEERMLNRAFDAKKKRSCRNEDKKANVNQGHNRSKARLRLARFREHVANQRSAFLWQEALYYAKRYDGVILFTRPSKPPIQYARDERTARSLCDGSYALFGQRLKDKCEEYGTQFACKEKTTWQNEKRQLLAQETMEKVRRILWQWRRSRQKDNPAFMAFLAGACERLATLGAA